MHIKRAVGFHAIDVYFFDYLPLSQLHPLPLDDRQHCESLTIRHRSDWDLDIKL